jgi:hypothetical protein
MQFGNETVYFTTPYAGQLRVNGTAYGAAIGASSTLFRNVTNNVGGQAEDDPSTASALWWVYLHIVRRSYQDPSASGFLNGVLKFRA